MSGNSPPLIQKLTPERFVGLSMDFIEAGCTGLLVKNGQVVRRLDPGRHFSFAVPLLEQCQLLLIDTKLRNLEIVSQGDLLTRDQFLVNVSLNASYRVANPQRVALELSDPIAALTSVVKDMLGLAIGKLSVGDMTGRGRVAIRQHMLDGKSAVYSLGFELEDVRVSDITFPENRGVIRQVEGMSARQEAEHAAALQAEITRAGRPVLPPPPMQQVNLISNKSSDPSYAAALEPGTFVQPALAPALAPTQLSDSAGNAATARLADRSSGDIIVINTSPFTIGREPNNNLALQDPRCSRYHAKIIRIPDAQGAVRYQLVDMGSSNGTFVGSERLVANQPFWLSDGTAIKIGNRELVFYE